MYVEVGTSTATHGEHLGGFPMAHMKGESVRWSFVATEVNKYEILEDSHQGAHPLMMVREILSRAASSPTSSGDRKRNIQVWGVRKAFFNADLEEKVYAHPGQDIYRPGRRWLLLKAANGTNIASKMRGESSAGPLSMTGTGNARQELRTCSTCLLRGKPKQSTRTLRQAAMATTSWQNAAMSSSTSWTNS